MSADKLQQYSFTEKEFNKEIALKRSLSILELADTKITIPLLAITYLSPLYSILNEIGIHADFLIYLEGKTGTRKSSLASLILSHFGSFNRDTFPCSFRDTVNSIEKKAYILADVLNCVDDYNPEIGNLKLATMEKLYAMYGDRTGRTRMNQNGKTLKSPYFARGLCLVTGELRPDVAQSRLARSIIINLQQNSIDLNKLSILQDNTEELSYCMKEYIKWIIENIDTIKDTAKNLFNLLRNKQNNEVHGRTNEIANVSLIGFTMFLQFLLDNSVINENKKIELENEAQKVFAENVDEQSQSSTELKPTSLFFDAIEQMFAVHEITLLDYEDNIGYEDMDIGKVVGYYDSTEQLYYFYPDIIFNLVDKFYSGKDRKFPLNKRTLWRYLLEEGSLYRTDSNRFTVQRTVDGKSFSVIAIKPREDYFEFCEKKAKTSNFSHSLDTF